MFLKSQRKRSVGSKKIRRTDLVRSAAFSKATSAGIFLKLENLRKTGALKIGGALNTCWKAKAEEEMDEDVIVVGGGTAGIVAAIAAARNGSKTAIIEQLNCLGGSQTAGLVSPLVGGGEHYFDTLVGGIHQELLCKIKEVGERFDGIWHDPETLKFLYEKVAIEEGVDLLYNTCVVGAIVKERRIDALVLHNKSGWQAATAKVFIDATGDGDLAVKAGCKYSHGRSDDKLNQAPSFRFLVCNVDVEKLADFLRKNGIPDVKPPRLGVGYTVGPYGAKELKHIWEKAVQDGELTAEEVAYIQFTTMDGLSGVVNFNCPELRNVDCTDAKSLTEAAIKGRRMIRNLFNYFRKRIPGFENSSLVLTSYLMGIRESRRIIGRYTLTEADILGGRKFPDAIVKSWYAVDIHLPDKGGVIIKSMPQGDYYEIPYRCIVPKDIDNLLIAGRCISSDFEANSGLRIQAVCRGLGQAAGTAAALCVRFDTTPSELDVRVLLQKLKVQGANLGQ